MNSSFKSNMTLQHHVEEGIVWDLHYEICKPYRDGIYSSGLWFRDDPTDHVFPVIMLQVILMFFVSRLMHFILKPLKQPKFICNLLAGIILGPSVLGQKKVFLERVFKPKEMLFTNLMSIIGVLYYIFLASVKMDKSRLITTARKIMKAGLTCFILPFVIIMILFYIFRDSTNGFRSKDYNLYISSRLMLSYFASISNALGELNLLTSELGKTALSCGILHEILGWVFLLLSVILKGNLRQMAQSTACLFVLILFIFFVLRPMVQRIVRQTPEGKPVDGFYIKVILAGPLIMGVLTDMTGTTILPGALLMGLIIPSGSPLGSSLVPRCEFVIQELILPFLYIRAGQLMNVYTIKDWKAFMVTQVLMLGGYLGKMAGCLLSLPWSNGGFKNSIFLGLILNSKGVIEISLILRWRGYKIVDEPTFTAILLFHMVVTAIVTPLLSMFYKPQARLQATLSSKNNKRTLQGMEPTDEFRMLCCIHSEDEVHGMVSLLKACNSTPITPMCVYAVHLSDLEGRAAPLLHAYNSQRKKFKVNQTDRIMRVLTKSVSKDSSMFQPYRVIAPYNTIHEIVCKLAQDKFVPFVVVPFPESMDIGARKMALHSFNINMQAYAPCTMGILVDRGLPRIFCAGHSTYNIGVFFLGGPDDREALALASRMSGHPEVSITVLRFDLREVDQKENKNYKMQNYLDDCLIREFKARNVGDLVVYKDETVENTLQVVDSIRSQANNYNLVIVGERNPRLEQELLPWVEHKELGVIGDMLASSDFCGGMVSVLVMHCVDVDHVNVIGSSRTISDERSRFSFSSSDDSKDLEGGKVLVADSTRDVNICKQV